MAAWARRPGCCAAAAASEAVAAAAPRRPPRGSCLRGRPHRRQRRPRRQCPRRLCQPWHRRPCRRRPHPAQPWEVVAACPRYLRASGAVAPLRHRCPPRRCSTQASRRTCGRGPPSGAGASRCRRCWEACLVRRPRWAGHSAPQGRHMRHRGRVSNRRYRSSLRGHRSRGRCSRDRHSRGRHTSRGSSRRPLRGQASHSRHRR